MSNTHLLAHRQLIPKLTWNNVKSFLFYFFHSIFTTTMHGQVVCKIRSLIFSLFARTFLSILKRAATCANNESTAFHSCKHGTKNWCERSIECCHTEYNTMLDDTFGHIGLYRQPASHRITIMMQTIIRADCDWNIEQFCRIHIVSHRLLSICWLNFFPIWYASQLYII